MCGLSYNEKKQQKHLLSVFHYLVMTGRFRQTAVELLYTASVLLLNEDFCTLLLSMIIFVYISANKTQYSVKWTQIHVCF